MERGNANRNRAGGQNRSRRMSIDEIYERAPSERQRAWQQRQRVERSVTMDIARRIGFSENWLADQTQKCHEFNVRVSSREAAFEEWASFVDELYLKFNRFIGLRYNPTMLRQVENLIILGRLSYGEELIRPVLSQLGIFVKIYLDENGVHNIMQLNTQLFEGPLPVNDPVFHFLPYRHGSLEDITQRVGSMPSIPIEIASTMDDRRCPICYDEFVPEGASSSESSLPMRLPCSHVFHSACIIPWLTCNPTCPLCRRSTFSDLSNPSVDDE